MGNDGGSIPDRRDLVRKKPKAEQADKANQTRARWFYCALSKRPLQEPIVSCALGKLYNKDAILEFLLDKSAFGDGEEICGHVKSLKDVKALKLTPNPAPSSTSPTASNASTDRAQFVCPLTLKEMNGSHTFVYIATCGCTMSQAGLRAMGTSFASDLPLASTEDAKDGESERKLQSCPQCTAKYDKKRDVRTLNPEKEEEEEMRSAMEAARLASKLKSKSKKRKIGESLESASPVPARDVSTKKIKPTQHLSLNPSIAVMSRAVIDGLAIEEAKRKEGMSDAVKSLYESKNQGRKETFMTRGTFTRYA